MAGINVNSKNVEQLVLKKQKEAEKTGNINDGTVKNDNITQLVKRFCNGEYENFNVFCQDLIKNDILEKSIKTTTLQTSNGQVAKKTVLEFQAKDNKKYTFYVPTEYVNKTGNDLGVDGTDGTKGTQSTNEVKNPTDTRDFSAVITELWRRLNEDIEPMYSRLTGLNLNELADLSDACSEGIGYVDGIMDFADDLTEDQIVQLEGFKTNFEIKRLAVDSRIFYISVQLNDDLPADEVEKKTKNANKSLDDLMSKVAIEGSDKYKKEINEVGESISALHEYKKKYPYLEAEINKIEEKYVKLKKYDAEEAMENIDKLDNAEINNKIGEYESLMDALGEQIESMDSNSINQQQIDILSTYGDTISAYCHLMEELEQNDQLSSQQEALIDNIQAQHQSHENMLEQAYNNLINLFIMDGHLTGEEMQTAQQFEQAIHELFPNAHLNETIEHISNGWHEGDMPLVDFVTDFLSDSGKAKYNEFLNLNTATYANKKKAVELINEILNDPNWGHGSGQAMQAGWMMLARTLNLRKEYLEQQIENIEKRMVRISDIQLQTQHVNQSPFR